MRSMISSDVPDEKKSGTSPTAGTAWCDTTPSAISRGNAGMKVAAATTRRSWDAISFFCFFFFSLLQEGKQTEQNKTEEAEKLTEEKTNKVQR